MTAAHREASGLLSTLVTVRIQGDIQRQAFAAALEAAGFETYTDCVEVLCVCSPEYSKAHRALLQAERAARLEHAQRHADLVRREGERNKANGYMAPERQL